MAKMSSVGLILVVVLAVVTVDALPAQSHNTETRDVAEAAEAYLARLLDNPVVQDFIASLDDHSETVEVSRRGLLDLAGHGIAGAANLGGNVVRTGAGVVGGLARTGVELLDNLFGSGANFVRNLLQAETRFVDNTARGASDLAGNVVGAADSVFYKRAPGYRGKRFVRLSPVDAKRALSLSVLLGHILGGLGRTVGGVVHGVEDVVGEVENVGENVLDYEVDTVENPGTNLEATTETISATYLVGSAESTMTAAPEVLQIIQGAAEGVVDKRQIRVVKK